MAGDTTLTINTHDARTSTTLPSSGYNVSRIPVFGSLSRLARRSTDQEEERLRLHARQGAHARHNSDNSRQTASCPGSGSTTPRSDSPENMGLTTIDRSQPHQTTDRINSNIADVALRMWVMARDPTRPQNTQSQLQARTLQIDAVRYMNMSLPGDLKPTEIAAIRASLPEDIVSDPLLRRKNRPTMLRRTVAQAVALFMALVIFFIPLLSSVLNRAMKYERQHRMTERVFVRTQTTVRGLADYRVQAQFTLIRILDSPIGRGVVNSGAYIVEGIAGGLVDGYSGYAGAKEFEGRGPPPTSPNLTLGAP